MEKYGVEVEPEDTKEKVGSTEKTCPDCGKELDKKANVPKCPEHGTKPFEKKD